LVQNFLKKILSACICRAFLELQVLCPNYDLVA